jgi:hypothetical protein
LEFRHTHLLSLLEPHMPRDWPGAAGALFSAEERLARVPALGFGTEAENAGDVEGDQGKKGEWKGCTAGQQRRPEGQPE